MKAQGCIEGFLIPRTDSLHATRNHRIAKKLMANY